MTMKLLSARRAGPSFHYRVHLDDTKLDGGGKPDAGWVLANTWSDAPRASGETVAQFTARLTAFETMARSEMRALCLARLAALTPAADTVLTGEGAAF